MGEPVTPSNIQPLEEWMIEALKKYKNKRSFQELQALEKAAGLGNLMTIEFLCKAEKRSR